jgi:hypothetical protein
MNRKAFGNLAGAAALVVMLAACVPAAPTPTTTTAPACSPAVTATLPVPFRVDSYYQSGEWISDSRHLWAVFGNDSGQTSLQAIELATNRLIDSREVPDMLVGATTEPRFRFFLVDGTVHFLSELFGSDRRVVQVHSLRVINGRIVTALESSHPTPEAGLSVYLDPVGFDGTRVWLRFGSQSSLDPPSVLWGVNLRGGSDRYFQLGSWATYPNGDTGVPTGDVLFADGDLWIASPFVLVRVDGVTGSLEAVIPYWRSESTDFNSRMIQSGSKLWVTSSKTSLSRVDPATNRIDWIVSLPGQFSFVGPLASQGDRIWFGFGLDGAELVSLTDRPDEVVVSVYEAPFVNFTSTWPRSGVVGGGDLWGISSGSGVVRLDLC